MDSSTTTTEVFFNEKGYAQFEEFLKENSFSNLFILTDSNTNNYCLSAFLQKLKTDLTIEVIEMEAGEENKTIETCNGIWKVLSELDADRKSLLVNLGGGVVTDLGGFVASTFKRGISFVHFPTSLLAMVDAAVGGKNGVNLGHLKNQVGVINNPALVIADTSFLQSLPPNEMRSGLAEMLKHGLIQDRTYWNKLQQLDRLDLGDLETLIRESIEIKENIVSQDPEEKNLRKTLNFGHTLGHAIESFCLENPSKTKLLHGEAVAAGMVLAAYLSAEKENFPEDDLKEIKKTIVDMYGRLELNKEDQEKIIELLKFDKKNEGGKINFVLLREIGKPVIDRQVSNDLIYKAFDYYLE